MDAYYTVELASVKQILDLFLFFADFTGRLFQT